MHMYISKAGVLEFFIIWIKRPKDNGLKIKNPYLAQNYTTLCSFLSAEMSCLVTPNCFSSLRLCNCHGYLCNSSYATVQYISIASIKLGLNSLAKCYAFALNADVLNDPWVCSNNIFKSAVM